MFLLKGSYWLLHDRVSYCRGLKIWNKLLEYTWATENINNLGNVLTITKLGNTLTLPLPSLVYVVQVHLSFNSIPLNAIISKAIMVYKSLNDLAKPYTWYMREMLKLGGFIYVRSLIFCPIWAWWRSITKTFHNHNNTFKYGSASLLHGS